MAYAKNEIFDVDQYQDTGCNLAPKCLTCPLPRCKYDIPQELGITRRSMQRAKSLMGKGVA